MSETLMQMTALIGCGVFWRVFKPLGLPVDQVRLVLTTVVYYCLFPAMVLRVLWRADIGWHSLNYTLLGFSCICCGILLVWTYSRCWRWSKPQVGAMMLAASFANVTNLGLPVLEQTFGVWARSVAIQMDLLANAPILFTLGVLIASHYGDAEQGQQKFGLNLLNTPPFWAAVIAVILNLSQAPSPEVLDGVLISLSGGVIPLMLFSLGLALSWQLFQWRKMQWAMPVIVIKLLLIPAFALWFTGHLSFDAEHRAAAVLEMAMPSMVIGIVFCDRYRLDSALYALIVTMTTALSLLTLPFWYSMVI